MIFCSDRRQYFLLTVYRTNKQEHIEEVFVLASLGNMSFVTRHHYHNKKYVSK